MMGLQFGRYIKQIFPHGLTVADVIPPRTNNGTAVADYLHNIAPQISSPSDISIPRVRDRALLKALALQNWACS